MPQEKKYDDDKSNVPLHDIDDAEQGTYNCYLKGTYRVVSVYLRGSIGCGRVVYIIQMRSY